MAEMVVPVGEGHGAEGTLGVFMEGTLFVVVLLQCMNVGKLKEYKIQSTLGFATMGRAANLALATRNAVTDLF